LRGTAPASLGTKQLEMNPSKDEAVSKEYGILLFNRSFAVSKLSNVLRRFRAISDLC
jgi:hypothetical protein